MSTILRETSTATPSRRGQKWLITIGTPGSGESGNYSAEVWESYGATAFRKGTKSYWKHGKPEERDPRDQVGVFTETFWNAEEQKFQGYLSAKSAWEPILEEMARDGDGDVSIQCGGLKDEDDNVLELHYHRANTVDFVGTSGLEGARLESLVESARAAWTDEPSPTGQEKEAIIMQEVLAAIQAQNALFETLLSKFDAKAKDEAQVVADQAAAEAAATAAVEAYSANIAAVEAAREHLLPIQVTALQESAKASGVAEFTVAIESAKKVAEEAKTAVITESAQGRDFASSTYADATEIGKVL